MEMKNINYTVKRCGCKEKWNETNKNWHI